MDRLIDLFKQRLVAALVLLLAHLHSLPGLSLSSLLPSDHVFLCFAASLVAAACVACSRLVLHLSPTWPPRLQLLTGYTWDNLIPCAEKLLMYVALVQRWKQAHLSPYSTLCSWFPVHMTAMSKRPASRRCSSPSSSSSSSSRVRAPTTVQARQPLWLSTCTGLEDSTPRRPPSRAWPPTPGRHPTSVTPRAACSLPLSASTAAFRPSLPPWTPSPASPVGLTKSACTTPAPLPASTDDLSRCCHFFLREMFFSWADQDTPRANALLI